MTWSQKWIWAGWVSLATSPLMCSARRCTSLMFSCRKVLSLDVLIPVNEVRKACGIPEPAKSVQILFRGGHGLGVWDLEVFTRLLRSGSLEGRGVEMYFSTNGGRVLNSEVEVCTLGLGHLSEVVFHRRLLGGSFAGMLQGGSILGTGEFGPWTCSNCGKPDCWSARYSCHRCGCPRYFDAAGVGQGKGGGVAGFHGQGVGGGMSGVRWVGALGRDQTYVSTGNLSYRKGNGRRGGAREEAVPGAGVGPGPGGNRVRFQEMLEKDGVPANKSGVGEEAPSAAQVGQGKTQRAMIFEAVEALRSLLGQGVCFQVEDLIQEHPKG